MILKAEATIDLDANRKIWIQLAGKTEEGEDPTDVLPVLAEELVNAAISAYEQGAAQMGIVKRDPLETFGDD